MSNAVASAAEGVVSFLLRNHLPFLMYLQPCELNDLLQVSKESHRILHDDDDVWHDALVQHQRLVGIRVQSTCVSLAYSPNETLSVDLALLASRCHWRLCRMLCRPHAVSAGTMGQLDRVPSLA